MLTKQQLRANGPILLFALFGVSFFSVPASAQFGRNGGAILYADPNFRGTSTTVRGETPDLRPFRLNDEVSSIRIPAGEVWEICQDVNFQANCETISSSVANLRSIGWDDRISSVRRVDGGYRDGGYRGNRTSGTSGRRGSDALIFYDRTGYHGTSTTVTSDRFDASALPNRRTRSVEVRGGTWQLCDRLGRCATVNQDVSDIAQLGLTGQITSVRPVNDSQDYGRRRRWDPQDRNYEDRDYRR